MKRLNGADLLSLRGSGDGGHAHPESWRRLLTEPS